MSTPEIPPEAEPVDHRERLEEALVEVKRVIAGQDEMLERVLVCLVAGGHLLIEGVPGLAKTLTIKTTAAALGGTFRRVQFTPDLVPSDLVGTRIYRPDTGGFDTEEGPVFCNFLLADEINRAPAKVQSALLEVMQERQVTIGHDTHLVPDPFLVMATQNPIESEGTYPLPEAQVDRFMLKVVVGYPSRDEELTVVQRSLEAPPVVRQVLELEALRGLQRAVLGVYVDPSLVAYAVSLAEATRNPAAVGLGGDRGVDRVRRQPAGPDRARPECAGVGVDPRSRLRARHRRPVAREGRAAAPAGAHLSGAGRAADGRRRARRRAGGRCRAAARAREAGRRVSRLRAFGVVETPERPGPGPMPEPLLRALELSIGRRVDGLLAGDHRSNLLGRGSELAQIRPYVPGDDVRLIDWNVTARTREAHVRVQLAERVLVTWIVLDRTLSMGFGTADRRKADVALGVALALGHAASVRGNRVGLLSFGSGSPTPLRPRQGRTGLVGLLLALGDDEAPEVRRRDLMPALALLGAVARQRSLVAVVSDFRGPRDWRPQLVDLAARHDVLAVEVRDPREEQLVDVGRGVVRRSRDRGATPSRHERCRTADTVRRGRRSRAAGSRRRPRRGAGVSRRALDQRGLAATSRRSPGGASVSFETPIALLGLLAIPVLVALLVVGERRRRQQGARFGTPALVALVGLTIAPKVRAVRSRDRRAHSPDRGSGPATRDVDRAAARSDGDPGDRHVTLHVRDRRAPSSLAAALSAARSFSRHGSVGICRRHRDVLDAGVPHPAADDRPRCGSPRSRPDPAELRNGPRRCHRPLGRRRAARRGRAAASERTAAPATVLLLSDGAQTGGRPGPARCGGAGEEGRCARQHSRARDERRSRHGAAPERAQGAGDRGPRHANAARGGPDQRRPVRGAPTAARLQQVYRDLGGRMGKKREEREVTAAFAGFGAVLLLVASGLSLAWTRRPL